jgi:hypothetical protein
MDAVTGPISVGLPCNDVLPHVRRALESAGCRALETFDLQLARSSGADCGCPHHGAAPCDCQLVVLVIYGESTAPISLMLHGTDGRTWITLPDSSGSGSALNVAATIRSAIHSLQAAQGL